MKNKFSLLIILWQYTTGCYYNNFKSGLRYIRLHLEYLMLNYPYMDPIDIIDKEIAGLRALIEKYGSARDVKYLVRIMLCSFLFFVYFIS